jgi:Mg2+/Co2+ transporter CorB
MSLTVLIPAFFILLGISAFFSMSETAMLAASKPRLASMANNGHKGAILTLNLLKRTDRLLGTILLGNNFVNAAAAAVSPLIIAGLIGNSEWGVAIATLLVTFLILVFAEATPKIIAANHATQIAVIICFPLYLSLILLYPVVWFVGLFVQFFLKIIGINQKGDDQALSQNELRLLILESSHFGQKKHRDLFESLFELDNYTVEDVMIPRRQIESLDIENPLHSLWQQIQTAHHSRLLVCQGGAETPLGILHVRSVLAIGEEHFTIEALKNHLQTPYFVPDSTPLLTQLHHFHEEHKRMALVVDEYGELEGLVTLEDMVGLIVGEFPQQHGLATYTQLEDGIIVDGSTSLRELNQHFSWQFDLTGPKTLNGLIIEYYKDIPEVGTCFKHQGCLFEIMQINNKLVRRVKLTRLNQKIRNPL